MALSTNLVRRPFQNGKKERNSIVEGRIKNRNIMVLKIHFKIIVTEKAWTCLSEKLLADGSWWKESWFGVRGSPW